MRWREAASAVRRDSARKVIPPNRVHSGAVHRARSTLLQIPIGGSRDREDCAGWSRKVSVQPLLAVCEARRRRDSFAREHSRFLLPDAPAPRRVLGFAGCARRRARRRQLHRRSSSHICVSEFRRAKRAARAPQVAADRDRVFRHIWKARAQFRKARPRWQHAPMKIAQLNCRSFPIRAIGAVFRQVGKEPNHLFRKVCL